MHARAGTRSRQCHFLTNQFVVPVVCPGAVRVIAVVGISEVSDASCSQVSPDPVVNSRLKSAHCIERVVVQVVSVDIGSHVQELVEEIRACCDCKQKEV